MVDAFAPNFEIVDENHYYAALIRLEAIFHAQPDTREAEELELLASAIERYEDVHYPIPDLRVPVVSPTSPSSTRDFRLELALLPPHLQSAACAGAGLPWNPALNGVEASEAAFEAATAAGRLSDLEEGVRALADFEGLETVVFEEDDLDVPNGWPWYAGSLFEVDAALVEEPAPLARRPNPEADMEVLVNRLLLRGFDGKDAARRWISSHVIPAYGMTAAKVMEEMGLGEMLDFLDALDAGVYA